MASPKKKQPAPIRQPNSADSGRTVAELLEFSNFLQKSIAKNGLNGRFSKKNSFCDVQKKHHQTLTAKRVPACMVLPTLVRRVLQKAARSCDSPHWGIPQHHQLFWPLLRTLQCVLYMPLCFVTFKWHAQVGHCSHTWPCFQNHACTQVFQLRIKWSTEEKNSKPWWTTVKCLSAYCLFVRMPLTSLMRRETISVHISTRAGMPPFLLMVHILKKNFVF